MSDNRDALQQQIREKKAFVKPHFGPEDPDPYIITDLAKKKAEEAATGIDF